MVVAEEIWTRDYRFEQNPMTWKGKNKNRCYNAFIHSGKECGVHERGVAIALGPRTVRMLEKYECVNEIIVWCRLKG